MADISKAAELLNHQQDFLQNMQGRYNYNNAIIITVLLATNYRQKKKQNTRRIGQLWTIGPALEQIVKMCSLPT